MENQMKHKKFWKPPSFEDFNILFPNKKIKLDCDLTEEKIPNISEEISKPKTARDLAIHSKKIEEVRSWLKRNLNSKASILLLTGPPGCGKTTTLKVLANEQGIQIKEWTNPVDKTEYKAEAVLQDGIYDKFSFFETSQIDKFEDFTLKSGRYNPLFGDQKSVLILVKDIPNIFIWKPKSFHEFLEKYKICGKSPIVFIITEDQNLDISSNLFPNNIKNKKNITNIKFNPVNHSSLMKNLRNFCDIYCPEKVSLQILEEISRNCNGDLRSAVNDLVLYLRTSTFNVNQNSKKAINLKKDEYCFSTKLLSLKNHNFGFYQVLGRILYPKLMTENERPNSLNSNQLFLHDVQKIADTLSGLHLDILQENYLNTFTKLQDVVGGSECFSFCDILVHHEELEQYTTLIAIISLMLKNTTPRKRGFKPIKKSFKFEETNTNYKVDIPKSFNHHLNEKDLLLDVMPFMRFLNTNEKGGEGEATSESCEESEDKIEIEEFDE